MSMNEDPYYECEQCGFVGYLDEFEDNGRHVCPDCGSKEISELDGEDEE